MVTRIVGTLFLIVVSASAVQATEIEILRVRPDAINARHLRDSATATRMYREPGGWVTDDAPLKKTESLHPKGVQPRLPGAELDAEGGTRLRADLKLWARESDLSHILPVRETKGDKG